MFFIILFQYLLHEEINVKGKMQLHDFKRFTLKGSEKDIEFHIKRGSNKITLPADINTEVGTLN